MRFHAADIAKLIGLFCMRTMSNRADIEEMVEAAIAYRFDHVSVLQCQISYTRQLLQGPEEIHVVVIPTRVGVYRRNRPN